MTKKNLFNFALFFVPLSLYLATLNHSIFPGDPTEFITAIGVNGVAHPPGYPLYLILGKIFSLLPWGSLPEKINLMSAVFGAATVALCGQIILKLTLSRTASSFGAGLLATSSPFWLYSTVAEVFTLHAFILALFIFYALNFLALPSKNRALFLVFLLALNASNHHTAALLLPALIFVVISKKREAKIGWNFLPKAAAVSIAGALPYIFIVIAARHSPPINWDNAVNLKNLIYLILRRDFGTGTLAPGVLSFEPKTTAFGLFVSNIFIGSFLLLPIFALAGLISLLLSPKKIQASLLWWGAFSLGPLFIILSGIKISSINQIGALLRFYMAPTLFLSILAGAGFYVFVKIIPEKLKKLSPFLLILLLPLPYKNWEINNQRNNFLYRSYGEKVLSVLPPNSIFLTTGDISDGAVDYLQLIEKLRPDIAKITLTKTVAPWYREQIKKIYPDIGVLLTDNPAETMRNLCKNFSQNGKLFISGWSAHIAGAEDTCIPLPRGPLVSIAAEGTPFEASKYKKEEVEYWKNFISNFPKEKDAPADLRTARVHYALSSAMDETGLFLLNRGEKEGARELFSMAVENSSYWFRSFDSLAAILTEEGKYAEAIAAEREAIKRNPDHPWAYYNLGILLKETGKLDEARKVLIDFLSFRPDSRLQEVEMTNRALNELR